MDVFAPIIRSVLFPLGFGFSGRGRYYQHYRTIESNQWRSPEAVGDIQRRLLGKLVSTAFDRSEFYRERFRQADVRPGAIASPADLSRLPLLKKRDLQESGERILARGAKRTGLRRNASGGSTGEPTAFFQDADRNLRRGMDQLRHDEWTGWKIGERVALLWGSQYDLSSMARLGGWLSNTFFYRRIPLDAFSLTDEKLQHFADILRHRRPVLLQAYASAAFLFAQFLERREVDGRQFGLRAIVSSAERLDPTMREVIERVFGCEVFDRYGSREVGLVASECERHQGLHVNADNVIVEILRADGTPCSPGERGKIVVTDLWNRTFPFIRYETGDVGRLLDGRCACGRGLPLMSAVEGRETDFIVLADGRSVHGEYFTHLFYGVPGLRQFRLHQTRDGRLHLSLVREPGVPTQAVDRALETLRAFLGTAAATLVVEDVSSIEPAPSGKRRFTSSDIRPNQPAHQRHD